MASSYSTDLKIELMVTGENAGTWGDKTNANLNVVQQAIAGFEAISIAGGAQTTNLLIQNSPEIANSKARNAVIKLTGTITGNQIVTVPTGIEKTYIVQNGTTGAFTVEFKQAGGTGVTFAAADKSTKILFADGTNIVDTGDTTPIITQINDTNVNEQIKFTTTASAVNELTIANAATGNAPEISATGSDTNIDLKITPKGTGKINLDGIKFPSADGSAGQALVTDGSGVLSFADAGRTGAVNWDTTAKTTTVTAASGVGYFVNTTSGAVTVNLPSAVAGDIVAVSDYANTAATNNIIIDPNGTDKIQGVNSNYVINVNGGTVTLVYVDSTQGWRPTDAATASSIIEQPLFTVATGGTITTSGDYKIHTFTGPGTFTVTQLGNGPTNPTGGPTTASYLVQAGGAHGAGGYREGRDITPSYTASPKVAPAGLTLTATSYPITVGGGQLANTTRGSDSVFDTITSTGGGAMIACRPGGSGGGFPAPGGSGGTGNTPPVSPPQGFPGGPAANGQSAGGGGGATEAGQPNNGPSNPGGRGGAGTTTSITGSSLAYAGGGGGAGNPAGLGPGPGSPCGTGGAGAGSGRPVGVNGTTNTGGGGGSSFGPSPTANSGTGGSGVIVVRYKFQ